MGVISFEVAIPSRVNVTAMDFDEVRALLPDLIAMLFEHQALRRLERRAEVVDLMLKDVPMRSLDKRIARLQARALERVYTGTEWLTAQQIGEFGRHGTANPAAAAQRWKDRKLLFALRRDRRDIYPRYALTDNFTPVPAIRDILAAFGNVSPSKIAAWFESTSSFLNGLRPRELIATHPERVLDAANDAVVSERMPA